MLMSRSTLWNLMPIASVLLHRVCATVCQLNPPSWHTLNPLFSLSFILMCATCAMCATLFRLHIGVFYILMNYFFNLTYIKNRWHTWHTPSKYLISLTANRESGGTHSGTHPGTHPLFVAHINFSLGELS